MAIEFGLSRLRALKPGLDSGCACDTGGVGATAVVASGSVWIGGVLCAVTALDVDISAVSPASGTKYIFARLAAGQSSTATLDATSVDPRPNGWAVIGLFDNNFGGGAPHLEAYDTSGVTGHEAFGRAQNCSVNITYDNALARGGTLVFGNDQKMYNGNIEGTLEFASISGQGLAEIYGGEWASGGAGSGTMTLTATQSPIPFAIEAQQITNGVTGTIKILKCYSNSITLNMDRENYLIPSLNFVGVANSEGDVMTWNI